MFGILMPPGHEDIMEDHYEDIPCWESERIALACLSDLLNEMMDIQYIPSKELAQIYFLNNDIFLPQSKQISDVESIEMVKKFPVQLESAFWSSYRDKLIIATNALINIIKKKNYKLICTKQLKEVVTHNYVSRDKEALEQNTRKLWWEFKLELNKYAEDQSPDKWYWYQDKDPAKDFVIENKVTAKDVHASLVAILNQMRMAKVTPESKTALKHYCMHILMIRESICLYGSPKAITQHEYSDICNYVLDNNVGWFAAWDCPDTIDLAQVVMVKHLSKATRHVAKKFEKPSSYITIQSLLKWFAVESYVVAKAVRKAHKKDGELTEVAVAEH